MRLHAPGDPACCTSTERAKLQCKSSNSSSSTLSAVCLPVAASGQTHSSILQRYSTRCPAEFVRLIKDPAATHIELKGNIVFSSEFFPPENANDQSKGIKIEHQVGGVPRSCHPPVAHMMAAAEAAAAAAVSTGCLERWRQ